MNLSQVKLEPGWKGALAEEFGKPYVIELRDFLRTELAAKKEIYPPPREFFAAFDLTPLDQVKVVILGQDPYHGPGQAHGLCFSVRPGVPCPPSLRNIFSELKSDCGIDPPPHGNLEGWAKQGVLLLNAILSVEAGRAASHQNRGWEQLTDAAIAYLNKNKAHLVFVLWGSYAQKKAAFLDGQKHLVIRSAHPSPLSAHRGFFGSRPFSRTNEYLQRYGRPPINWAI